MKFQVPLTTDKRGSKFENLLQKTFFEVGCLVHGPIGNLRCPNIADQATKVSASCRSRRCNK